MKRPQGQPRISIRAVLYRNGRKCHICGFAIDFKAAVPAPKAATMDHVIPLAHGGAHSLENLKPAHFICNVLKKDDAVTDDLVDRCRQKIEDLRSKNRIKL